VQASLTGHVNATAPDTLQRYANPPADTMFPLEYMFHLTGDVRGLDLLEYGCGDGADTALLASRGARVHALDLSPELLELAAKRILLDGVEGQVTFLCGSAHDVPLPDESMDVVVGHSILHHLDLALAAREVHRVLRRGGRAIFYEPIRDSRVLRKIRPLIPYRQPDVSPFERPLLLAEIDAFGSAFRRGRSRVFLLPFVAAARVLGAPLPLQNRLRALDARLLANYAVLRRYASVIVFELYK
jgi:SAM-dependent methyltransferase